MGGERQKIKRPLNVCMYVCMYVYMYVCIFYYGHALSNLGMGCY